MTDLRADRPGWRDWLLLLVVLAVFGALCFSNLGAYALMNWDASEYASLGRSMLHMDGYKISERPNFMRPPWWPASIAAVMWAAGDETEQTAKIATVLYSLLAIALVYWGVWVECGRVPATFAAWSLAICPEFTTRAVDLLSEQAFMALHLAALLSFYFAFRGREQWFYAGWIFWSLSFSTRYTGLLFGPLLVMVFLYEWVRDRGRLERLLRTRAFWLSPIAAGVILAPWYLRQWLSHGDPLTGVKRAAQQIPSYSNEHMPWHFYFSEMPDAMTLPIAALAVMGLLHGVVIAKRPLAVYLTVGAAIIYGWHMQYDYKEVRLAAPALPLLAMGVGLAVKAWMDLTSGRRWLGWTAALALMAISSIQGVGAIRHEFRERQSTGETAFLQAIEHIRQSMAEDIVLVGVKQPQIYWYSDRETLRSPRRKPQYRQRLSEADWVVITSYERSPPPYLTPVFEEMKTAEWFGEGGRVFRHSGHQVLIARPEWVLDQIADD